MLLCRWYSVGPHGKPGDTGVLLGISADDVGCHPGRWLSLWGKFSTSFFLGRIISARSTEFWVEVTISDGCSSSSSVFIREVSASLHPSVPRPQHLWFEIQALPEWPCIASRLHTPSSVLSSFTSPPRLWNTGEDTGTSISKPVPPRALLLDLNIPPHLSFSSASSCSLSWSLWVSAHSSQCWPSSIEFLLHLHTPCVDKLPLSPLVGVILVREYALARDTAQGLVPKCYKVLSPGSPEGCTTSRTTFQGHNLPLRGMYFEIGTDI